MERAISAHIRGEVQTKLDRIIGNPEYYDRRQNAVCQDLRSIGDVYSFWIENPELRVAFLTANSQADTIKKKARKGIQAIHNAWYTLMQRGKYGNFVDELNIELLEKVNGLVEPEKYGTGKLRTKDVTLNIPGYTPPSWERVRERTEEVIAYVKGMHKEDPLEAAIALHLGIAATQPFIEGNKRTSRLVQDRILYDSQFPPAIIQAGEGKFYFDLLARTMPHYKEGYLEGQRQFYDYCASKVNNGLDEILGDMNKCAVNGNSH